MKKLFALTAMSSALLLAACGGGDINLNPTTVDNSTGGSNGGNNGGGTNNPCASYVKNGSTVQGTYSSGDCSYSSSFVSANNPITADQVTFAAIPGVHEFDGSLFIGEDVDGQAAASGTPVLQEGQGTKLNIEAGVTMVFKNENSYVRITRG